MVTLFGLLNIGASGLFASQAGLNTTGHNIANADTRGYSRQRINQVTNFPLAVTPGSVGTGTLVRGFERLRDQFLEGQIRVQLALEGFLTQTEEGFDTIQALLNDPLNPVASSLDNPAEAGINYVLKQFFSSFQELVGLPESIAVRSTVVQTAVTMAETFNLIDTELTRLRDDANSQVSLMIGEINSLTAQIAELNVRIGQVEADERNHANDLRDQRDLLLRQLSEKVPIQTFEDEQGQVLVSILGVAAVNGGNSRNLIARTVAGGSAMSDIFFDLPGSRVLTSAFDRGQLGGLLNLRDNVIPGVRASLDELASGVIDQVNRIHSRGAGLVNFRDITGVNTVTNASLALNDAGLDYAVRDGVLAIRVANAQGVVQRTLEINVSSTDTLDSLAAKIDAADGVLAAGGGLITAVVDSNNRLLIAADGDLRFSFAGDTSGVLSALGINTLFTGSSAATIAVRDAIQQDLRLLAASATGAPGNGDAALEIAQLENALTMSDRTTTFGDFYRSTLAQVGVEARRIMQVRANTEMLIQSLDTAQERVSGVSMDEEAVNLIRFQQAFSAAARFITGTDELIDLVVNRLGLVGR